MKGREFFEKLRLEPRDIEITSNVTLSNCGVGGRWIQYLTEEMRLAFGTGIHYEILGWYSGFRVVLHDERGVYDEVWKGLGRIAKQHSSILSVYGDTEIALSKPMFDVYYNETRSVEDDSHALAVIEAGLRELFYVFNPFLAVVADTKIRDGETGMRIAAQQFVIPRDIVLAEEALNRFINEKIPLKFPGGLTMEPNSSDGYAALFSHQIYRGFLDDDNVHFELLVRNRELSVELHDERGKAPDKLYRCCKKVARQHKHIFDSEWCSGGFSIRLQRSIVAGRDWELILSDVERDMEELWSVYGPMLSAYAKEGDVALMNGGGGPTPMREIPSTLSSGVGLISLSDFPFETFSWVTTIADLFSRQPISCNGVKNKLVPGDYVIPVYQRKYAWSENNVAVLCRDLLRAASNRENYHLGTIIIHVDKNKGDFFVVDGQQRLRTISRLLSQKIFKESKDAVIEDQFSEADELRIWRTFQLFLPSDRERILLMLKKSTLVCIAVSNISESFQLFSTQNGRGRQLSPENLLKAYHFHELERAPEPPNITNIETWKDQLDEKWEVLNGTTIGSEERNLLGQVLGEHLYRIRAWLHDVFPESPFSVDNVCAFKGLTICSDGQRIPLENLSTIRRYENSVSLEERVVRSSDDKMDPFVFMDQPIINGFDFFRYVSSCCQAYRNLFLKTDVTELKKFNFWYKKYCCYPSSARRGDTYARHVFQSLCLYCYDRFGAIGLSESFFELYRCAYYERAVNARCYYHTCGREFVRKAVQVMASVSNLPDLKDRLSELSFVVCEKVEQFGMTEINGLEPVYEAFYGDDSNV